MILFRKEESINIWNSKLFGVKMSIYMKDKIAIIKVKNVGPKYVIGYDINIGILRDYLDKKGLLQEDGYMFKD
jgi:NurA-like 5'-3' nuclease